MLNNEHITDHFSTFIMLHSIVKCIDETKIKINFSCNYDENNRDNYQLLLNKFDWQSIRDADPHIFTREFLESIDGLYIKAFPLKVK